MRSTFSRLWLMFPEYRWSYFLSLTMASMCKAGIELLLAICMGGLMDAAVCLDMEALLRTILWFVMGIIFMMFFTALSRIWFESTVSHMSGKLRRETFNHVLHLPMSQFEQHHSGDLISRLNNDMQTGTTTYGSCIYNLAETLIWALTSTVYLFAAAWQLGVAVCLSGLIILALNKWLANRQRALSRTVQTARGQHLTWITDLLAGHKVIRFFGLQDYIYRFVDKSNATLLRTTLQRAEHTAKTSATNELSSNLGFLGLVAIGAWLSARGVLTVGTVVAAIQLQTGTSDLFLNLGRLISRLQASLAGLDRIWELLDLAPEPQGQDSLHVTDASIQIEFKSVDFAYGEQGVLTNISFKMPPGKTVALVGPSGSGKSTILKLLLGYYEPSQGTILVNGHDITRLNKTELRRHIAIVPQESSLFGGTVNYNINRGRQDASPEEILAALELANAREFVLQHPPGLDTIIGSDGISFSDGEQQRLSIARAALRKAPILLLDEPTSALDSESESYVQEALTRLMRERTCLVVAHRLWTIQEADLIVVLKEGQVVAQGTHQELMEQQGTYRELVLAGLRQRTG